MARLFKKRVHEYCVTPLDQPRNESRIVKIFADNLSKKTRWLFVGYYSKTDWHGTARCVSLGRFIANAAKNGLLNDIVQLLDMKECKWSFESSYAYVSCKKELEGAFEQLCQWLKQEPNHSYIVSIRDRLTSKMRVVFVTAAAHTDNTQVITDCLFDSSDECILTAFEWGQLIGRVNNPKTVDHLLSLLEKHDSYVVSQVRRMRAFMDGNFEEPMPSFSEAAGMAAFSSAIKANNYTVAKKILSLITSLSGCLELAVFEADVTAFELVKEHDSGVAIATSHICRVEWQCRALAKGIATTTFFVEQYPELGNCCDASSCFFCQITGCELSQVFAKLLSKNMMDRERLVFLLKQAMLQKPELLQKELQAMLVVAVKALSFVPDFAGTILNHLDWKDSCTKQAFAKRLAYESVSEDAFQWTCYYFELQISVPDANEFMKQITFTSGQIGPRTDFYLLIRLRRWQRLGASIVPNLFANNSISHLPTELLVELLKLRDQLTWQELADLVLALIYNGQTRIIKDIFDSIIKSDQNMISYICKKCLKDLHFQIIDNNTFCVDDPFWQNGTHQRVYLFLRESLKDHWSMIYY